MGIVQVRVENRVEVEAPLLLPKVQVHFFWSVEFGRTGSCSEIAEPVKKQEMAKLKQNEVEYASKIEALKKALEKAQNESKELKLKIESMNHEMQRLSETNHRRGTLLVNALTALKNQYAFKDRIRVRLFCLLKITRFYRKLKIVFIN